MRTIGGMRVAGYSSWVITEDEASYLAMALFIRDSAGLDTSTNPAAPPPLHPAVPVDESLRSQFDHAGPAWNAWWSRLLRVLASAPSEPVAFEDAVAGAGADIRPLLDAGLTPARRWAREQALFRPSPRHGLEIVELVHSVEQQQGRQAAPFHLDLLTLPVRGFWSGRAAVGRELPGQPGLHPSLALLLSGQLRADRAELDRVLRPVIVALA
jgi:hypothetical protein